MTKSRDEKNELTQQLSFNNKRDEHKEEITVVTKDIDDRDGDMSINNTDIVLEPCLVGFEDKSGEKGNGKHGGTHIGQTCILLAWDYPVS